MKKILWVGFFTVIGTIFTVALSMAADLRTIEGTTLETMMADGKPIVIVDVREPELFSAGHIKGAINPAAAPYASETV